MLKKIALAAAFAATASFATYNFFPVGNTHTGQVEIKGAYGWSEKANVDWSNMKIKLGAEYVVMDKLELSIFNLGYQLWNEPTDCDNCPDSDGLMAMTVGARYWFMPMLGAALDVNIPLNSEEAADGKFDPFGLYAAIQFSQELIPNLVLGSEAGLSYKFEDEDRTDGLGLTVQAEFDYTIASIGLTPWIGGEFDMRISDVEEGKGQAKHEYGSGDSAFTLWIGAGYSINPMFYVKANFLMTFADEKESLGGDSMGVNAALDINF